MSNSSSLASKRIQNLLDDNSFVEIGALVSARATDFNMKQIDTPADGVVTGYGIINGNLVYVYSQDSTVLGGSIGEMHAKKIAKIYDMAMKMGAPVIGLIDSAGIRLQEATDALNGFGKIYQRQAMASGVIPQITAVFGNCGGGLAMLTTLSDFTFMVDGKAKLFVNTPNSIEGNTIAKCDTSSASYQSEESGIVDVVATEEDALAQIRDLVSFLPANNENDFSFDDCDDDLNRACENIENAMADSSMVLSTISDNSRFFEVKADYAKEMVTGFIKLNGATVGCVANRSKVYDENAEVVAEFDVALSAKGCEKAAEFINFCDAFEIPVLSLTNVKGYVATTCSEKRIAKAAAKLTYAFANATVPKVNVIMGEAFGSAYIAMNSKSIGADITIAWDGAKIGMMDSKLAAKIICDGQGGDSIDACAKEYDELQNSVVSAARRGYVDQIIDAVDTRKYVIGAFEMLFTKSEGRPDKKHGTV